MIPSDLMIAEEGARKGGRAEKITMLIDNTHKRHKKIVEKTNKNDSSHINFTLSAVEWRDCLVCDGCY